MTISFLNSFRRNGESLADMRARSLFGPISIIAFAVLGGIGVLWPFFQRQQMKSEALERWEMDCVAIHSVAECDRITEERNRRCSLKVIQSSGDRFSGTRRRMDYPRYKRCMEIGDKALREEEEAQRRQMYK